MVSKVLQKARELSVKPFETELIQPLLPKQEQSPLNESTAGPSAQKWELKPKTQIAEQKHHRYRQRLLCPLKLPHIQNC